MTWSDVPGEKALPNLKDSGEGILQLGKGIANAGAAMQDTQIIAVGGEVEGWTGLAATAHQGQAAFLQKTIQKAIDLHPKIPALLDKYVQEHAKTRSAITGLQHDWDEARTVHLRRIAELAVQLKAGLYPGDDDEYEKDRAKADEACEKTQKEVKAKYEAAVRSLNELAKSTGDSIFGLADSFAPKSRVAGEGNGTIDRNNLGVELFGGSGGVLAAQARWEDARADADKAAKVFLTKDGKLKGNISQKDLDSFNAAYGERMAKDPFFANAFGLTFGTNNIMKLTSLVSSAGSFSRDSARELRAVLGSSLILTTGGIRNGLDANGRKVWNAWYAGIDGLNYGDHTSLKEARGKYLDSLNKLGLKEWEDGVETQSGGKSGYWLISGLIADGAMSDKQLALGDDFLNGKHAIADDIVRWSYKNPELTAPYMDYRLPLTNTWDPVQNMLVGMDGNPSAARTFLASKTSFDVEDNGGRPMSMVRYLVGHRHIDSYRKEDELSYMDNGDALANVIDDASSDKSQPQSAYVVREFLHGYTDGLARSDDEHNGQDSFGYYNHGLRDKAGDILKEYASDFANEIRSPSGVDGATVGREEGNEYHLALTRNQVISMHRADSDFFKDIAFSKKAKSALARSLEMGFQTELETTYKNDEDSLSTAELQNKVDKIKNTYIGIFNTVNAGSLAADVSTAEDVSQDEANTVNGLKTIASTAGSASQGRVVSLITGMIERGFDFATSNDKDKRTEAFKQHQADKVISNTSVEDMEAKAISRAAVRSGNRRYKDQAIEFNRKLNDPNQRFIDENGNWLVKVDPETGDVTGEGPRLQGYNDYIKEKWIS